MLTRSVSFLYAAAARSMAEVIAVLKTEFNEHMESQADGYTQTLTDKARGK